MATRVAVIQWHIKNLDMPANHQTACTYIRSAASQGAKLAVLPEYHLNGWEPTSPLWREQARESQSYLTSYASLAKELNICIVPGTVIEEHVSEEGKTIYYNVAYFLSNTGAVLGSYRKKNIWHPERPHLTSSSEERHVAFDTPIGKVGLLICWDLAFPEAFRELIAAGAEMVIVPTYWTPLDAGENARSYNPDCEKLFLETTLTSRCFENTCAVIFANAAGPQDRFLGLSRVTMPIIGVLGSMGCEEGCLVLDMDMELVRIAEENYKVRKDIGGDEWHYVYR
ncbi:hypothetical protein ASPZODRAFT_60000 [Penicilliopsis zonata CBS 506.65]|uniref:CN hydrolase domain-containing protein n=1 Tax=Penicilliopsis zonata CBS 506.65 TaxID=1073090 RepID=A0A1L9SP36_9EURO|nr:hypothetical protein ASPZODRAFT_60000 [Penicilliopsis zonata CBS 506.65]OJJ49029.1 hypothetical protein ASPZODRAFT_60000 [Penicilliopsis zonata CBS 506.65]